MEPVSPEEAWGGGELIPGCPPEEVPGSGRASFVLMHPYGRWSGPRSQKAKPPNPGSF